MTSALHNVAQHTRQYSYTLAHPHTQTHVSSALYSCLRCVCDTAPQLSRQRKLFAALAFSHVHQCVSARECVCVYILEKCHLAKLVVVVVVVAVVAGSAAIAGASKNAASCANYGN